MTLDKKRKMKKVSRKIFLDIGSHIGETLEEVIKPQHNCDLVFGFEPITECCDVINKNFINDKLIVNNFGLYKEDCEKIVYYNKSKFYGGNLDIGGSIYEDKIDRKPNPNDRDDKLCSFKDVGKWFKDNITKDDYVMVKINVEGAECDIIERLIESEEYDKIDRLLIDFDCRKIPSQKHRQQEVENLLTSLNKKNYITYFPRGSSHGERIGNFIKGKFCNFG